MESSDPSPPFRLDPSKFNRQLYSSLLQFWLPGYPNPSSKYTEDDILRWFRRSDAVDNRSRELAKPALDSIGPEHFQLPPFKSLEDDQRNYVAIAAPFSGQFNAPIDVQGDESEQERDRDEAALALCILLDQMPRNLFRDDEGKALVFTHYDRIARAVSHEIRTCQPRRQAAEERKSGNHQDGKPRGKGLDACPRFRDAFPWRLWFYLPLQHTELLSAQAAFLERLHDMLERAKEIGDGQGMTFCELNLENERKHRRPLELFGRYIWRNKCLGRETTPEEQKYLDENGGF